MRDEPDVRLVDPHPEGDGGNHHDPLAVDEPILVGLALPSVHAGVIGQRIHPLSAEPFRGLVHAAPRQAVDDAGVAAVLPIEESGELIAGVGLRRDTVLDVRTVEPADEPAGADQAEPFPDFTARCLVCGSRQRHPRHAGEAVPQYGELEVLRPEVVTPLRDTVRLVDGEERHVDLVEQRQRPFAQEPFRRGIQQVDATRAEPRFDVEHRVVRQRRIEIRRPHARLEQRSDLVAHQRDERRDDHRRAVADERGNLVAERFAPAGRHQHEAVTAGDGMVDDRPLLPAKAGVAEHPLQDLLRGGGHPAIVHRRVGSHRP